MHAFNQSPQVHTRVLYNHLPIHTYSDTQTIHVYYLAETIASLGRFHLIHLTPAQVYTQTHEATSKSTADLYTVQKMFSVTCCISKWNNFSIAEVKFKFVHRLTRAIQDFSPCIIREEQCQQLELRLCVVCVRERFLIDRRK